MIRLAILLLLLSISLLAQPHSVTLTWTWAQGTGDPATGFHIQRASVTGGPYATVGTVPVGTFTYSDATVTAGLTYFYVLTAYNGAGESAKTVEVRAIIPLALPLPPTNLTATVQ